MHLDGAPGTKLKSPTVVAEAHLATLGDEEAANGRQDGVPARGCYQWPRVAYHRT